MSRNHSRYDRYDRSYDRYDDYDDHRRRRNFDQDFDREYGQQEEEEEEEEVYEQEKPTFYCETCNVRLFDAVTFEGHLTGKSHQKAEQRKREAEYHEASARVTGRRVHELPSQYEERVRKTEEDNRRREGGQQAATSSGSSSQRDTYSHRKDRRQRPYDYGQYRYRLYLEISMNFVFMKES